MNEIQKYSELNETFNDLRNYIVRFDQDSMELRMPVDVRPNIDIQGALHTYCNCIEQAPAWSRLGSLLGERAVESGYDTWIFHWNQPTKHYIWQHFKMGNPSASWFNDERNDDEPPTEDTDYTEVNNLLT